MIDGLTALIAYLGRDADLHALIGNRIAAKHKFAMDTNEMGILNGWSIPSKALVLSSIPGEPPDLDGGTERMRLEVRCYGESQAEAMRIYNQLIAISTAFVRTTTEIGAGTAVIYWFVPDGSPVFDRDPDLAIDLARGFFRASVARASV